MVNVFRKPEECLDVAKDAVKIGAKSLWLQLGITNQAAADFAKSHGLKVIMDRCIKVDHRILNHQ
jgi:predicted CoA-binding protein